MWDYKYWTPEKDSSGSLWYAFCRSKIDTLKILGTHFSYNEKLKEEKNFYTTATNIQRARKTWALRNLTLEGKIVIFKTLGKIVIFKTLAISKIVSRSLTTPVPRHIVNELEKIQKAFLWKNSSPKVKHETLYNDYKSGDLKNINILNKIISLQYSWIRRLYDNSFHEWKLILLFLKSPLAALSNFFQTCFSREIKLHFFHLSIRKSFYTGKKILPESLKYHLVFCLIIMVQWKYPGR